jgi:multidrug efflux system membrane fusion protein
VRVAEAEQAVTDTNLRCPLDGIVVKRSIEVGALAAAGTVAVSVAEVRNVKANFGVPDTVLPRVALGSTLDITTEAFRDTKFHGRITRVDPTADPKSRVFEVEVTIPNEDGRLKTGMIAALSLADTAVATAPEPLVPLSAIVRSPVHTGGFAVYLVENDGKEPGVGTARARDVELGDYLGNVIPVTKGLNGGERIVTMGAGLLSNGEAVRVIP